VADGQVIAVENILLCCNPLSVAFKVNMDGTIKCRLVIDLSRWVNKFIPASKYLMLKFQDVLVMTSPGEFQSVFNILKAYHHLRLAPESYELVGFCVPDKKGIDRCYHFVVVVFGLATAGQLLGRIMRTILIFLSSRMVRLMVNVDDGRNTARDKVKADADYLLTLDTFEAAGFTIAYEKLDRRGQLDTKKEYLGFCIDLKTMTIHVLEAKLNPLWAGQYWLAPGWQRL
jgi:hypothetical protein